MQKPLSSALIAAAVTLASGCASMKPGDVGTASAGGAEYPAKTACGSFFVYEMCLTDVQGDHRVDYMYFADSGQIFMYRPDFELPPDQPRHPCAWPMQDDVVEHSSTLLYGEDLNLLQEMDVKRRLLLSYMAAKDGVDRCYGGDSRTGESAAAGEMEFVSDDFDWGED